MTQLGQLPPEVTIYPPGPACQRLVEVLSETECPALTARRARRSELSGLSYDPIVWTAARDANVVDADGNRFVDLTSGFGAAAIGHRHPSVVRAIAQQANTLLHALGDVHPSDTKVRLLERIARLAPFPNARVIIGINGSDAVEAALKTAALATGRPGVLAFQGGYHGLSYGALSACGYKESFRSPFAQQLGQHVFFAPYPRQSRQNVEVSLDDAIGAVKRRWDEAPLAIGAVLVEPIQGRGGVIQPPKRFLSELANLCKERDALLIVDEIFTGLGRCGNFWRSNDEGIEPDLICAGKALGGGVPISACIGRSEVMVAWGDPSQEALHTATFFGHPVSCAAALTTLEVIERESLCQRAAEVGSEFLIRLRESCRGHNFVVEVRGAGMMLGVELDCQARTLAVVRRLLEKGYITLAAGSHSEVVSITPPLTIAPELLTGFTRALSQALFEVREI